MKILPFEKCFIDVTGGNVKTKQSDYLEKGLFPIIDQGKKFIGGYTNDKTKLVKCKLPCIIYGDHSRSVKYYDQPFAIGADGVKLLETTEEITPEYGYYYLNTIKLPASGFDRSFKYLKRIKIPVHDIETQNKIAAVLHKAKSILDKRKLAISKYDYLLQAAFFNIFGDPVKNSKGWNTRPFNKIGLFISGATPSKANPEFWSGNFPWVSPKDMKVPIIVDTQDHISELAFKETGLKRIEAHHLLIVVRGMILAHSFPVAINSVDVAINQDMKAIKPIKELNATFLLHCLNALNPIILNLISSAGHGTKKLDSSAMAKLHIPIPPLELQERFVKQVAKVQSLRTNLSNSVKHIENIFDALSQNAFKGELIFNTAVDLEVLLGKDYAFFKHQINSTSLNLLIDRLNKDVTDDNKFREAEIYDKAKGFMFELLKEGKVKQIFDYKTKKVKIISV